MHEYALENKSPTRDRLRRIAKDIGFKSKFIHLKWGKLLKLGEGYPVIALLANGNAVIVSGIKQEEGMNQTPRVVIVDPLNSSKDFLFLDQHQFENLWQGELFLLKRFYKLSDHTQPFSLRWFIPEILRQRKSFSDIAIAALFMHFLALISPIFFQVVIDKVLVHQTYSTLNVLAVGLIIVLLFDAALDWLRNYLLIYSTSKIDVRVSTRTFSHLSKLPIPFFEQATAGVLTKHMQQTSSIRQFLTGSLFMTLLDASSLIVFIPALIYYSGQLAMIVIAISLLICLIILALIPTFRKRLHALYAAEGERQGMLVESIHGMRTVKALGVEPVQRKVWDEKASQAIAMHFRVGKISISARTISKFLEKFMTLAIIWYGAQLVFDEQLTIGTLVAFNMLAGRVSQPLVQLVGLVHEYQETSLSVKMLGSIMNAPVEDGAEAGGLCPKLDGCIRFEDVTFRYNPDDAPALTAVNFEIPKGKTV